MTQQFANLNWPQRLQIVARLNVSSEQAANIMGVTVRDLEQASKTYSPDVTFNAEPFAPHFSIGSSVKPSDEKPKRGRKSSKIRDAFAQLTTEKQPLAEFCAKHQVSEHCIRQHKRFAPEIANIVVRKDLDMGVVVVFLESDE